MQTRLKANDSGSVLLLTVGLIPILFLIVAICVDAAVLFSVRRSLSATADAAALAGAQSADLAALYAGRASNALLLDCNKVRATVTSQFVQSARDSRSTSAQLDAINCDRTKVTVSMRTSVRLPFAAAVGVADRVQVKAQATASSPFR